MVDVAAEIKKLMVDKRLVLGTERVQKLLRQGKLAKVYLSSNCPSGLKEDFVRYCALSGIECQELQVSNEELGVWCKRPFVISVLGVLKSAS
ncbi:MAG: ribosomal L7Ae/L30e/S12e/Gadd45 family protein [Candidatus Woesearchaeota archaeon]